MCCSPWDCKELDTTDWMTELNWTVSRFWPCLDSLTCLLCSCFSFWWDTFHNLFPTCPSISTPPFTKLQEWFLLLLWGSVPILSLLESPFPSTLYVVSLYPGPLSIITLISQQGSFCSALLSPMLDGEHFEGKEEIWSMLTFLAPLKMCMWVCDKNI